MAISDEDRPAYQAHVESYIQAFNPRNQPQADAVRLAANALWRTDRLTTIEASLLELEIGWNTPFTDVYVTGLELRHHIAIAFLQNLTEGANALDLCRRYLSSAQRDFQRAISTFEKLKELTSAVAIPEPQPEPQQEPESVTQQSTEPEKAGQELHLVQRDPNELPANKPSNSANISSTSNQSVQATADSSPANPSKAA